MLSSSFLTKIRVSYCPVKSGFTLFYRKYSDPKSPISKVFDKSIQSTDEEEPKQTNSPSPKSELDSSQEPTKTDSPSPKSELDSSQELERLRVLIQSLQEKLKKEDLEKSKKAENKVSLPSWLSEKGEPMLPTSYPKLCDPRFELALEKGIKNQMIDREHPVVTYLYMMDQKAIYSWLRGEGLLAIKLRNLITVRLEEGGRVNPVHEDWFFQWLYNGQMPNL